MKKDRDLPIDQKTLASRSGTTGQPIRKILLLVILAIVGLSAYWFFGDRLSFDYFADQEAKLRDYRDAYPGLVILLAMVIYVLVVGLSIPGATVLTLAYGWFFGFWAGLIMVSFGSTAGATLAFLMTRYFFREWVQAKFATKLAAVNEAFEREGAFYLFTLRLIPAVPFFVINAVMGLTGIRTRTFWWVSQLGMLPGTAAYVVAGASVPSLQTLASEGVGRVLNWQLLIAFAVLGLLPLILKRAVQAYRKRQVSSRP
jgi:uncharacterized membrane protein YdjX (TVP38/TMEM64 family)